MGERHISRSLTFDCGRRSVDYPPARSFPDDYFLSSGSCFRNVTGFGEKYLLLGFGSFRVPARTDVISIYNFIVLRGDSWHFTYSRMDNEVIDVKLIYSKDTDLSLVLNCLFRNLRNIFFVEMQHFFLGLSVKLWCKIYKELYFSFINHFSELIFKHFTFTVHF